MYQFPLQVDIVTTSNPLASNKSGKLESKSEQNKVPFQPKVIDLKFRKIISKGNSKSKK